MSTDATPQPLTHRRVLKIALPIVLSNATVPLLGLVDVGVVGQIEAPEPIAAVGMGAIIITTAYWLFGFLRMGTVSLVGQAAGAGDDAEVSAWLSRALMVAGVAGLGLIVLQWPLMQVGLWSFTASPEAEAMTATYLSIRIWSAPAAIAVYALTGWLVAMERTGAVFWVQLLMNGLNIALNFLFVLGFDWGVAGVALSTAIAEVVGAAIGLWFCRDAFGRAAAFDRGRIFARAKLVRMALLNTDILLRSAMLMAMFYSFVSFGSRFDDATLAANEVLIQFMYVTAYGMDGFAFAAETLIARAYGRKDPARVRRSAVLTGFWGAGLCVFCAVAFWLAGPWLIDLLAKDAQVQAEARVYLPWMVLAPLVGCVAWMMDGIFIGAGRGRDMRNMMAISFVIYWIAVAILLPLLGNHGVWAALLVSFLARGVTLSLRYPALERAAA
ncbi:MATE family efflux transporter [Tateyamaria sp. SN6-1]|uniref:MATE family efflux transporter n=1 Tax=Tateyamaria sp. SN6-1 TaxID=3092148 RepID=UPI0039F4730C